jgi:hypothetical protein
VKRLVSKRRKPTSAAPKTVEEYLLRIPAPARSTLQTVRMIIRSVVPTETTEVISYGMPAHFGVQAGSYRVRLDTFDSN